MIFFEVIGVIALWAIGSWISFVITFWMVAACIRGFEGMVPAIGLSIMSTLIWTMAYIWSLHP